MHSSKTKKSKGIIKIKWSYPDAKGEPTINNQVKVVKLGRLENSVWILSNEKYRQPGEWKIEVRDIEDKVLYTRTFHLAY